MYILFLLTICIYVGVSNKVLMNNVAIPTSLNSLEMCQ